MTIESMSENILIFIDKIGRLCKVPTPNHLKTKKIVKTLAFFPFNCLHKYKQLLKSMTEEPIIFHRGQKFTVEFAIQLNGASESQQYFNDLSNELRAKISAVIIRFADRGYISNKEKFRKLEGDLWEFKSYQTRMVMYYCEKGIIALTNGFTKKKGKTPPEEIRKGNRIKDEYDIKRKELLHE